ncbi:hypothetical protein [Streptomyces violaceusniger]|uniref:hypothetical protein n=1 Tax=Streptomyces violaceusniger TaxID=68280 RepID=UPI00380686D0
MINETERPAAAAPFPLPALLARLEADRARSAQNAADTWRKEVARVFEGEEGAFRTAIEYTIHAFYGLEAAVAYHRNGALPSGSWRSGGGHTVTGPAGTPDEDPKAEAAVADVRAECDAMEKAMSQGHASLHRLREHIGRIRDALGTREAS